MQNKNQNISFLKRIFYVWGKEYKMIFTDFAAIFTFFIITLGVSLLYSYVYSEQVLEELPIAVVDEDFSTESRLFTRMLDQTPEVEAAYRTASFSEAQEWFKDHKVRGIVVIPERFSKDLFRGRSTHVSVYCDASFMLYYRQVYRATKLTTVYMNKGITLNAQGKTTAQAMEESLPVRGVAVSMYNTNFGYSTFIMPVVYIILLQYVLLSGIGLLGGTRRENSEKEDKHIKVNNIGDALIVLIGRAGAYASIAFFVFLIFFSVMFPLFNLPQRGQVVEIMLWMLPFILSVVFLGITLTTFFRYREDAVMVIMLTSIPTLLISGINWPMFKIPLAIQAVANLIPSTMTAKGFVAISQAGCSLQQVSDYWGYLWGLTAFFFVLAMLRMRQMKEE